MRILNQFAPYGPGNMSPTFMSQNIKDTGWGKCVGEEDKHIRCTATQAFNDKIVCIGFGLGDKIECIKDQKLFNAVYSISENHWNGAVTLQLKLKDIKP
jgi:single-stranded-DNA-specific exonuclease